MDVFKIIEPIKNKVPFILSIHHSGTNIPSNKLNFYNKDQLKLKEDTDWYLDQLYDFAPKLGITTIKANFSRWLVDLNRNPENKPLYNDGRIITSICPTTNFDGKPIYIENYKINKTEKLTSDFDSIFKEFLNLIREIHDWNRDNIQNVINDFLKNNKIKFPVLGKPIRHLLTNNYNGPSITDIFMILGKKESIERLKRHKI